MIWLLYVAATMLNELSLLRECFPKPKKCQIDLIDNTGNK